MRKDSRGALGKLGEDLACAELKRLGYAIVDRRFRTRWGELDIVARHRGVVVFVEVRARSSGSFGTPFESVTWQKRQRITKMAFAYMLVKRLANVAYRFDIASVSPTDTGELRVEILQSAFDLSSTYFNG